MLLERDEALRKAREDLAAMRTVAVEWETEVASTRAQLQQDRATLKGAAEGRAGREGYRSCHGRGAAPAGAENAPSGGILAPARVICSLGGPSCPRV
jgi:hypothetical protein